MTSSRLKRTIFQKPTFVVLKGPHKGKELRFCRKIPGTSVWLAKELGFVIPTIYRYIHKEEIHIMDRIGADTTFRERVETKFSVRLSFLLLDLAGASPFLHHDEEGKEFMVALRPRIAKWLFPHVTVKQGYKDATLSESNDAATSN